MDHSNQNEHQFKKKENVKQIASNISTTLTYYIDDSVGYLEIKTCCHWNVVTLSVAC